MDKDNEDVIEENPLVSIIMPVYNLEDYVFESINSVVSQSYQNIELIVVDDGSMDKSFTIVQNFAKIDPRVRPIKVQHNIGLAAARNLGLEHAQGTWISFLDGDDIFLPSAIESKVEASKIYPESDIISSDFYLWYPEEDRLESKVKVNAVWSQYFEKSNHLNSYLEIKEPHHSFMDTVLTQVCVVMVKSSIIKNLGGFDTSLPMYEDVYMWLLIAAKARSFVYVPVVSACYRQRTGSLTRADNPPTKYAPIVFKKLLSLPEYKPYTVRLREKIIDHIQMNTYWYREREFRLKAIKSALSGIVWGYGRWDLWKNLLASLALRK